MKTATKVVLAVSLAMIILGGGLATMAWAISGGDIGVNWSERDGFSRIHWGSRNADLESGYSEPGAFQSINLESDYGTVKLVPGSSYRVEYNLLSDYPPVEISVNGGMLTVRNTPGNLSNGLNLNFFGHNNNNNLNNAYIYVYYPQSTVLTSVSLNSGLGSIEATDLNVTGKLEIDADLGEVKLTRTKSASLEVDADLGSVDLDTVTADTLSASLSMGELTSRDCVLGDTEIDNDMGATTLRGDIAGNVDISCSMGSVEFTTSRPRSDYFLDLVTDIGQVMVDGKRLHSGDAGDSGLPYRVTISCDMGNTELWFGK